MNFFENMAGLLPTFFYMQIISGIFPVPVITADAGKFSIGIGMKFLDRPNMRSSALVVVAVWLSGKILFL